MSNFNYFRITNLNYNNNSSKIDDQLFYFNGENTMLNLKNGGGKSVIVQMMMAPFMRKKYRDLNDRKFDGYFTGKMPTYIMAEWNLDDGAGYLLTGMMVKKKENSSDENSNDTLDIINFIHEYKSRNKYDIKNIPIIEKEGEGKRIKSFANSKKLFEELKRSLEYDFNYYDMNNYTASKAYFNKLKEYGIDNKEWENIIKKVNLTESGLSQLFKEAKNTEGLIKNWFLPTVEEKLSKDEDRIKAYRDIIERYIYQYKRNKSNIDRKKKIEIFNERAKNIKEATLLFKEYKEKLKKHENKIANFYRILKETLEEKERLKEKVNNEIFKNKEDVKEIKYEEVSMNIYSIEDEIDEIIACINKENILKKECEDLLKKLKKEKNILTCAKAYEIYKYYSEELQNLEIKISLLRNEQKDKAPRINDLGFSIKNLLQLNKNDLDKEFIKIKDETESLIKRKEELEKNIEEGQTLINSLYLEEGKLEKSIDSFNEYERDFNKNYNEKLLRNIIGFFNEEDILNLEKKIYFEKENAEKQKIELEKDVIKKKETLKAKESEKDKINNLVIALEKDLSNSKKEQETLNNEIEQRKDIIKYVNLEESSIFDNTYIINEFIKKLEVLNIDLKELYKVFERIEKEITKLKLGKIMELPKEFIDELKNKDINIVYGMEWLKKNGYSKEENMEIINRNPFIPYSLIMSSKEISILEKNDIDVFTSSPVPIILRENLNDNLKNTSKNIIEIGTVKFYISFNKKLLNEEELKKILLEKEEEKKKILKNIEDKRTSIELYNDKKSIIQNSKLTKELYDELLKRIKKYEEDLKLNNHELISIKNIIEELKEQIEEINKKCEKLNDKKKDIIKKEEQYNALITKYKIYKEDKEKQEILLQKKRLYLNNIEKDKKELKENGKKVENNKEILRRLEDKINNCSGEFLKFDSFQEGKIIEKDLEDLLAEYNAMTKGISENIQELEEKIKKMDDNYKKAELELCEKSKSYELEDKEFKNVIYDSKKEVKIEKDIENENINLKKIEKRISDYEKEKTREETKIEGFKEKLTELNKCNPKERKEIFNKDFKEELAKLSLKEKELKAELTKLEKEINTIEINKNNLSEYDFQVNNIISIEINLKELESSTGKLKRDYRLIKEEIARAEKEVTSIINNIYSEDIFKNESLFIDAVEGLQRVCNDPNILLEQLEIILDSYEKLVEKLMHDIEMINKEEDNILRNLYEYISLVNENIGQIDDNSTITIGEKSIKMLKISVVDMEENKELYMTRLKEYLQNIRNHCVGLLEENENINEYIQKSVTIIKLYDEIISIGNINVKLYKVEENRQKQITWDEVAKNSGGEGFLSAFVILSSLLSYMRKEDKDIFSRKEISKVLIMDNPFAQTNAEHLLKPLIDISKKSKTQLICLTGLGGDSIINRFDNIYVMNLVNSKLKNGLRVMKSEHIVGDEEKEVIVSSRVKVEDVQEKLF
ncbi:MAG: hypothetical protein MSA89_00765 [Clostridium sp.]|nr:hypothetical protein [Clostridium sp.]